MRERMARHAQVMAWAGLAAIVIALGGWLVVGKLELWTEIVGAVGTLLLALTVLLRPNEIKAALTGRQARYGGNALLMSAAFFAIVGLVNYLGARHHKRWDVTEQKQFSISQQSIRILESLKEPVQVKLFFTPGHYNRTQAEDMIKEYAIRSSKLNYEFIDPDLGRRLAIEYNISRDGTTIFERGDRREVTFGVQEQDLTSALLKVTRDEMKGVYFLTGHKELDPESGEDSGYGMIKQMLENENYRVAIFNLAVTDTVPADMDVLVVAGPQTPLSSDETARLRAFFEQGVSLLILVEAGYADPFEGMLADYGVDLTDDLVIDPERSFFGDIATPLVDSYEFHQITKDMGRLSSFFPTVRSVVMKDPSPEGWNAQYLVRSSESSWAEADYRERQVEPDDDEAKGPLGLAVVIEPSVQGSGTGRLVVIGDADFVQNRILSSVRGSVGNVDLFMNAVGWLAEEEELISIRPKPPEQRQVVLTEPQARAVIYSNILFVPLLVLVAGAVVWWRKR